MLSRKQLKRVKDLLPGDIIIDLRGDGQRGAAMVLSVKIFSSGVAAVRLLRSDDFLSNPGTVKTSKWAPQVDDVLTVFSIETE
jgi:hypothetical protein